MPNTPPADNGNAADATVTPEAPQQPDTAELQKKIAELEERNAAYRKGVDRTSAEKKAMEAEIARLKVLAGEKTEEPSQADQPKVVTHDEFQKELSRRDFERLNEGNFSLLNDEGKNLYQERLSKGDNPQDALDLALFRSGVQRTSQGSQTQQGVSSPAHGVDRTGGDLLGIPHDVIAHYKKDYPDMKDEEIAKVISEVQRRNPNDYKPA